MGKYTTGPAKVHLNSHIETIRSHSIKKNIGQMQNFGRNTADFSGTAGICYLCLNEKLFIIEHQGNNLLNQQNELISKCKHKNKFKLMSHKT